MQPEGYQYIEWYETVKIYGDDSQIQMICWAYLWAILYDVYCILVSRYLL